MLASVTIPTDADPPIATGTAENSESQDELFHSMGLANQELQLAFTPFLGASAEVPAGNGGYGHTAPTVEFGFNIKDAAGDPAGELV